MFLKFLIIIFSTPFVYGMKGEELAKKVYFRPHGKIARSKSTMRLTSQSGKVKIRQFEMKRLEKEEGNVKSIIHFSSPKDVQNTSFLTIDHKTDESIQFIYLPAINKVNRISSNKKSGRFVGSDFYYEDLSDRVVSKDLHKLIGNGKYEGQDCLKLESTPTSSDNSIYSKKIACIHPTLFIPLQIDFFDKRGEKIKELFVKKIEKIQGYFTVTQTEMKDIQKKHTSLFLIDEIVFDEKNIDDNTFKKSNLSRL